MMSGYLGGYANLLTGSPQPFFDFLANNEVSPEFKSVIAAVRVNSEIACVTVLEDNLFDKSFINEFHLIKIEDDWKIVAKLFHHD